MNKQIFFILLIILFNGSVNAKGSVKGNGSTNPNDYQYRITVTTDLLKVSPNLNNVYFVNGTPYTVTKHSVHKGIAYSNSEYVSSAVIFDYTFQNYDSVIEYLPKLYDKLHSIDDNENIKYDIELTIIGLKVSGKPTYGAIGIYEYDNHFKRYVTKGIIYGTSFGTDDNKNFTYKTYTFGIVKHAGSTLLVLECKTVINLLIQQYGNPQNSLVKTKKRDKFINEIYVDNFGEMYIFDKSKLKFIKYEHEDEQFTINDL